MDTKKFFDAIVLSGGGPNGVLILGTLHYYYEICKYVPSKVNEYAGASIGSVICLLLVCGYTPMEIFKEIFVIDDFFEISKSFSIVETIKNMGIISINRFMDKVKDLVLKKMGKVYTLKELYKITKKKLYISATDISNSKEIKYSYKTQPDMLCIEAVTHSCNIPIIFHSIKYENKYIVDGGVTNNYPWNYISKKSENILGVLIRGDGSSSLKEDNFLGYSYKIIMTPISILSELRCQLAPKKVKTIKLKTTKTSYISINKNQKMIAFLSGYQQSAEQDSIISLNIKGWEDSWEDDWGEWS